MWVPGAALVLFLVLFTKTQIRPRWFTGAIATTAGHIIWFLIGSAFTGVWSATAADIALLTAGIVWLWLAPGLASALFLGLIQLVSLGFNIYSLVSVHFGSFEHRALTSHCAFRLIAIGCLVVEYLKMRRERSTPPPFPETTVL